MIAYLLDTDICIELIRRRAAAVLGRLLRCRPGSVGISAITFAELQYGVMRSRDPERNRVALALFCSQLEILPFDDRAAILYGEIRTNLERRAVPIGALDTLIAAQALSRRSILVTNNEREFRRVTGLRVENWLHR